jgi:hypothetical protein
MTKINEFDLVQNTPLGSILIWSFVAEYYKTQDEKRGASLPHLMLVLPLLFNQEFVNGVYTKNKQGGLYNALNKDRVLFAGVQGRMESMSQLTFRSIHVGMTARTFLMDKDNYEFIPIRSKAPDFKENESIKRMLVASKRLGYWFSTIDFNQLCALLKVRF